MNKRIVAAALLGSAIIALAGGKDKDPVLMTIDGQDIRLSEFEYLYNKNNSQQAEPVTFEQYVDMFIDYKLKVADARAEGIDTTKAYQKELAKFFDDLAKPYLRDSVVAEKLVQDVYDRMGEEVYVSHIMFPPQNPQNPNSQALADSVRNLIVTGAISFEDAAREYSVDKPSAKKGGQMGWVNGNSPFPWEFEEMCFSTPVGQISEIVNSGFGLHIIRPENRRPASGEVHAQHILLLTQDMNDRTHVFTDEEKAAVKARIDSIYNVVTTPGVDFSEIAKQYSQDPGSAPKGGDLGWFGVGRMVPEFEEAAYSLADGEISKPFATSYGYHIVRKIEHRGGVPLPPIDQVRTQIQRNIDNDSRSQLPVKAYIEKLSAISGSSVNGNIPNLVADIIAERGIAECDSAAMDALLNSNLVAFTVNGKATTLGDVLKTHPIRTGASPIATGNFAKNAVDFAYEKAMLEYGKEYLAKIDPEFRNLTNEYRDGILLFEISNKNVWNRATEDAEGLEAYFQAHRDAYAWDKPRYKAFVIFTVSDSIADAAKAFVNANFNPATATQKELGAALKKEFGKDIRVERVIAVQGENPYTDYLGFGGAKPEDGKSRWTAYFDFGGHVINAPEEAIDVKGPVTADYQADLEKAWLDRLHKTYKVKVNQKVLKKAAEESKK